MGIRQPNKPPHLSQHIARPLPPLPPPPANAVHQGDAVPVIRSPVSEVSLEFRALRIPRDEYTDVSAVMPSEGEAVMGTAILSATESLKLPVDGTAELMVVPAGMTAADVRHRLETWERLHDFVRHVSEDRDDCVSPGIKLAACRVMEAAAEEKPR